MTMLSPKNKPGARDVTIVLESLQGECNHGWGLCAGVHTSAQDLSFQLRGTEISDSISQLHLWHSNQRVQKFEYLGSVPVKGGLFSLGRTMQPDSIYTLSTTIGQKKGSFSSPPPPSRPFPFPYKDDFQSYPIGGLAKYFSDQGGYFKIGFDGSSTNKVLTQVVTRDPGPNAWIPNPDPITVIGSANWTDYYVSCGMRLDDVGSTGQYLVLCGRLASWAKLDSQPIIPAYCLNVSASGQWRFTAGDPASPLAVGRISGYNAARWHTLQFYFSGRTFKGLFDSSLLFSLADTTFSQGAVAIGSGFHIAYFRNFFVSRASKKT